MKRIAYEHKIPAKDYETSKTADELFRETFGIER